MTDMTDHSKLIAEARQWAPCAMSPGWQLKLITKLADALEAAEAKLLHYDQAVAEAERLDGIEGKAMHASDRADVAEINLAAAEAKLARVRNLHAKKKQWEGDRSYMFVCEECTRINRYGVVLYPCPTILALMVEGESKS